MELLIIYPAQQYKLIIEKTGTKKPEKHGFEIISNPDLQIQP